MTINLPATPEEISTKELMVLTGQTVAKSGSLLPVLRVNYDDEDEDGNTLPRGSWVLTPEDGGPAIYSKDVIIRPLWVTFQYNHYDADKAQMVSTSVHFNGWNDDIIDSVGTHRCGKLSRKEIEKLPPERQEQQRKIKLAKVIYGVADIAGVDKEGNKSAAKAVPCVFYARGTHFMPMAEFLDKLESKGTFMGSVNIKVGLKREKNQGVTYWEAVPSEKSSVVVTRDDLELIKKFSDTTAAETAEVTKKWQEAQNTASAVSLAGTLDTQSLNKDFDDDPNEIEVIKD